MAGRRPPAAHDRDRGRGRKADDDAVALDRLLAAKEIVICCGSGGVGKTTTAAALAAMAAAHLGGKVLVITVDPARRLATALGLEQFGNVETRVPHELFVEAGTEPRGELWAAMLDTKQSWDDLVRAHAPDAATRDAILANPLYDNITSRFVHSHDYIAMERLYDIHRSGRYDLIVVDTPPTRNAIDFLEAPERMADFFSSRLLRWLTVPAKSRVFTMASKPFYRVADRILGSQFLEDIAQFFLLFQTMYDGFVERSRAVTRTLADKRTTFVVVSTLEPAPVREAEFFVDALAERRFHLGAIVLNKVLPEWFMARGTTGVAKRLCSRSDALAAGLPAELAEAVRLEAGAERSEHGVSSGGGGGDGDLGETEQVGRVLAEVGESFLNFQLVAKREAEQRAELASRADVLAAVPYADHDITDLSGLLELGDELWRER
ncbi:MAG TPA: ArsA-related P-loop ATPase [Acidimicrobiales bacterium]|nr:ArsA-related P-loop ATPase [Acidimicrobiales bacterium]